MGQLIAVLSGKGGTGKTSVCAGIASTLAQMGEKVLCIDCDPGLRNLDIALGIAELGALSFLEVSESGYGLDKATVHPLYPTLHFLTAPINCAAEDVDADAFGAMLSLAREQYSYIFLDAASGIGAGFRLAAQFADRVMVVTGADPASIRNAGRVAEVLELMGKENVRLVINRITKKTLSAVHLTVDDIMDHTGLPLLGIVPEDPDMLLAAVSKQPLPAYTRKGAAAACSRIAKLLQGQNVPVSL